jgi:hypothetical protein
MVQFWPRVYSESAAGLENVTDPDDCALFAVEACQVVTALLVAANGAVTLGAPMEKISRPAPSSDTTANRGAIRAIDRPDTSIASCAAPPPLVKVLALFPDRRAAGK